GGIALIDLGGRWQLRTEPQAGPYVRRMLQVKPLRLTRAALEALAIIAYRQPITRPEMEDLRGVDCGAVTRALLERKLIRIRADQSTKITASVLAPPAPPEPPKAE